MVADTSLQKAIFNWMPLCSGRVQRVTFYNAGETTAGGPDSSWEETEKVVENVTSVFRG